MFVKGYTKDSNGNTRIIISNDSDTKSFSLKANESGLQLAYEHRNINAWQLSDHTKNLIEMEIKRYIYAVGTENQKDIVFSEDIENYYPEFDTPNGIEEL